MIWYGRSEKSSGAHMGCVDYGWVKWVRLGYVSCRRQYTETIGIPEITQKIRGSHIVTHGNHQEIIT